MRSTVFHPLPVILDRICNFICTKTRMTTLKKNKVKKSYDQTNTDKYRVAANITEYHIISKLIFLRLINSKIHEEKTIISCKKCM